MRKIYLLFLCLILITQGLVAQSAGAYEKHAEKSFEAAEYCNALEFSTEALKKDSTKANCINIAAQSAFSLRLFGKSKFYFEQLRACSESANYPEAVYFLAEIHRILGNRAQAITLYQTFIENGQGSAKLIEDARSKIEICSSYDEPSAEDDPCYVGITVKRVPELYTCESELGPFQWQGKVYFTSTEFECKPELQCNANLIVYEYDGYNKNEIKFPDSDGDISHMTFNADGTRMYYNECECERGEGFICAIYYRDWYADNNAWGPKVKLPETVNVPGKTATQPRVGESLENGGERLYYVSNRDGSTGGADDLDIWYVDIVDGQCSEPQNFSLVNTPDKDITPFLDRTTNLFYFSSIGRNGIGGFDIYRIDLGSEEKMNVEILPEPINSVYDDLYFSMGDCKGHFTSNRPEEVEGGVEAESCCLDPNIYEVEWRKQLDMEVTVYEEFDSMSYGNPVLDSYGQPIKVRKPLNGVTVTLNNQNPQTDEYSNAYYYTDVELDTDFEVKGTKIGYTDGYATTTSSGFNCGCSTIKVEIVLKKKAVKLIVFTKEKFGSAAQTDTSYVQGSREYCDVAEYSGATNVSAFLLFNKPIQPINGVYVKLIAWPSDQGITDQTDPNGNRYEFDLEFQKNYYLFASKDNYTGDQTPVFSTDIKTLEAQALSMPNTVYYSDSGDTIYIVKNLYLFQPLPLYFDNAIPRPVGYYPNGNNQLPEDQTYYSFYNQYCDRESDFKSGCDRYGRVIEYTQDFKQDEIQQFFSNDLYDGMRRLTNFAAFLNYFLDQGYKIHIEIEGGASGRALNPNYDNQALSRRRASSLDNYFKRFPGENNDFPLAKSYAAGELSSKLEACGTCESKIPKGAPDCIGWFSREASLDRRVKIIDIKFEPRLDELEPPSIGSTENE